MHKDVSPLSILAPFTRPTFMTDRLATMRAMAATQPNNPVVRFGLANSAHYQKAYEFGQVVVSWRNMAPLQAAHHLQRRWPGHHGGRQPRRL